MGATERMHLCHRIRYEQWLSSAAVLAAAIALLACAGGAQAGILLPQPVGFDANDLKKSFDHQASRTSSSSSGHRNSQIPSHHCDDDSPNPLGLVKSHQPADSTSSSGSSSSSAGGVGSSMVVCGLSTTITIVEDTIRGRLAEDHDLSLPNPPGTDLLRPPRAA